MEFGSSHVYAPKQSTAGVDEFEYVPESRYNHTVTGYASGAASNADYQDDGEVSVSSIVLLQTCFNNCDTADLFQ